MAEFNMGPGHLADIHDSPLRTDQHTSLITVCTFQVIYYRSDPVSYPPPPPLPVPLQVHLQTQQEVKRGLWEMGVRVVQTQGVRGLYNGLTASLTRQVRRTQRAYRSICNSYEICAHIYCKRRVHQKMWQLANDG